MQVPNVWKITSALATDVRNKAADPEGSLLELLVTLRKQVWLAAIFCLVSGYFLLWLAVENSGPLRGLAGALLVTLSLKLFIALLKSHLDPDWISLVTRFYTSRKHEEARGLTGTPHLFLLGLGFLALGAGVIWLADSFAVPAVSMLGVALMGLSVAPFSLILFYWSGAGFVNEEERLRRYEQWVSAGLGMLLTGWLVAVQLSGGLKWLGAPLLLIGLLVYQLGLDGICGSRTGEERRYAAWLVDKFPGDCTRDAARGARVALALILLGSWRHLFWANLLGGLLFVTALITLSVAFRERSKEKQDLTDLDERFRWWLLVGASGAVAALIGILQLVTTRATGNSDTAALVIGLVVALIGASFAWRGESLFFAVLIGFAIVFALANRTVDDPSLVSGVQLEEASTSATTTGTRRIVAFGDSWISGEGAPKFYEATDEKGDERNECRRAPSAYPVLLAEADDGQADDLDFYACSGAKLADVIDLGERVDEQCRNEGQPEGQYPCSPADTYGRYLQIDNLLVDPNDPEHSQAKDTSATELVLVSIGGNDVGFGQIVQGCLLPGSCADRREVWLDNIKVVGPGLEDAYRQIKEAFGDKVPVVVMPYPLVMTETSCGSSPLVASEHAFIVEFTTVLNHQIQVSAERAGVHFFEPGMFAFQGQRICDPATEPKAINLIKLQATDGDFFERIHPKSWTHNSMHPNRTGHRLTFNRLKAWLEDEKILSSEGEKNPPENLDVSLEILGIRPLRPFAVDTTQLFDAEATATLVGLGCDPAAVDGFASRVQIFDDPEIAHGDPGSLWWPVPISGASAKDSAICYTDQNGEWRSAGVSLTGSETPTELYEDSGEIFLKGRPSQSDPQWALFANSSGGWELRAIQYCSASSQCEASFGEWSKVQIKRAYKQVAQPLALALVGGWLFALGWSIAIAPWLRRRLLIIKR